MKNVLPYSFNGILPRAAVARVTGSTLVAYWDHETRVGVMEPLPYGDGYTVRESFSVADAVMLCGEGPTDLANFVAGLAVLSGEAHLLLHAGNRIDVYRIMRPGVVSHVWSTESLPQHSRLDDASYRADQIVFAGSSAAGVWACGTCLAGGPVHVTDVGASAAVALDREGLVHVCFHHDLPTDRSEPRVTDYAQQKINRTVQYACVHHSGAGTYEVSQPEIVAEGISGFPSIATTAEALLVVFHADGSKRPALGDDYVLTREGAGASVGYACRSLHPVVDQPAGAWIHGNIAISREIVVRESGATPRSYSTGRLYPLYEWHGHPVIAHEADGAPVVVWCEETNGQVHWARWLGSAFEDPPRVRPVVGGGTCSAFVGLRNPDESLPVLVSTGIGAATVRIPQPERIGPGRCFIDVADYDDFSRVTGVCRHIVPLDRFPQNPVFAAGAPGTWDADMVTLPFVVFVPERNVYAMYYSGGAYQTRRGWRCGYAESHDGINWHRRPIVLNGVEQPGNQSPYLYPFRDVEQRDPSRRYVSFFTEKEGGHVDGLAYSPDCLHWTLEPEPASTVNSTLHVTEIPVISYRDPNGVYFCIGRSFYYSGRSLGIQYSDDLITWGGAQSYPERPDGDPGDSTHCATYGRLLLESSGNLPHEHQIYYGYGTKERDNRYWLYYAPCRADCRYELALAAGRNGTDFDRVVPGEYLLPCGPLGAWDNGFIAGFKPVIVGDTLRFYYGSSGWHHNTDKHGAYPLHRPNWRIGMAEGARGKQVCVQCSRVSEPGRLRTKEIQLGPDQTILGAVFDGPSDAVRVTAFGPAGRPAVSASGSQLPVRLPRAARIWVDVEIRDPAARFFGLSLGHRGAEVVR